jgi:hypothetical protein
MKTRASNPKESPKSAINRRQFCSVTAAATLTAFISSPAPAGAATGGATDSSLLRTGNGEWTYNVVAGWGELPSDMEFGGTHGGISTDNAGNLYVSTQSTTGILVYSKDGKLLRTIVPQYPEVHSIVHSEENGVEYFYCTVQKGTPKENWLFVKIKPDGTVVQKIFAPKEAGFDAPNAWRITGALPGPDGSIYIANGYGDSRMFIFDKAGNYKTSFSGKGSADGLCNCCHGISLDTRYDQPYLMVCDRENYRLSHYDLSGKFVRNLTLHMRRPCQVSFLGDYAVVSELQGRVTIIDKDNVPVAFLGDNPNKTQWANYEVDPKDVALANFSAAHGCFIDKSANIYVSDWNHSGRVTKLTKAI